MIDIYCKDLDIYIKKINQKIKYGNLSFISLKVKLI